MSTFCKSSVVVSLFTPITFVDSPIKILPGTGIKPTLRVGGIGIGESANVMGVVSLAATATGGKNSTTPRRDGPTRRAAWNHHKQQKFQERTMASNASQEASDGLAASSPSQHVPNLAGSVITADGVGGEKISKFFMSSPHCVAPFPKRVLTLLLFSSA